MAVAGALFGCEADQATADFAYWLLGEITVQSEVGTTAMEVLVFIMLFAMSAVIVAIATVKLRKRRHRVEKERQHRKAEEEHKKHERSADEFQKVGEGSKLAEEEARLKVQEQQAWKTEIEAGEKLEKDEPRQQKAENKRGEVKGESERVAEESQQEAEERRGGERLMPLKRGGGPRGSTERPKIEQPPETKPRSLKPEVVCWNEGWTWIVGIEVPEELKTLSVTQSGEPLEYDNTDEQRYRLRHADGRVKITWVEGNKDITLVEPERSYLIFKMRRNWKEPGRLARSSTTGYYLVVVPQEWERDEEVSGIAPVTPESVHLDGHKAHFFYQGQSGNTVIGFISEKGEPIRIESGRPRFQLAGREIADASEDMGPLFGEQPPCIQTLDEQGWNDVSVMLAGEEGSGRNRWRTQLVPQASAREQKLPEEIADRRGGWYFVRIYDNEDNLLESMDFRFLAALNDIRTEKSELLPGANGYDNVTVRFLHRTDCKVELVNEDTQHALAIRRESSQTIVSVPPEPDCDKTCWILHDNTPSVELTVLVERMWWAFGEMGVAPTGWVDKLITLPREDFIATTDKALWVRLPRLRFVDRVEVGFDRTRRQTFRVEVDKTEFTIPLRGFCDAREIEDRQQEARLMIWVQPEGAEPGEAVIAKVLADELVPIQRQWSGCGRMKTAIADAVLWQGAGELVVNDEPVWTYFRGAPQKAQHFLQRLLELEEVSLLIEGVKIDVEVIGSQPMTNRQIKAVAHAVARALVSYAPELKELLRGNGFGGTKVTGFCTHRRN